MVFIIEVVKLLTDPCGIDRAPVVMIFFCSVVLSLLVVDDVGYWVGYIYI